MILDFRSHNLYTNDMVCRATLCSDDTWQLPPLSMIEAFLKLWDSCGFHGLCLQKLLMVEALWILKSVIAYAPRPKLTYAGKSNAWQKPATRSHWQLGVDFMAYQLNTLKTISSGTDRMLCLL